MKFKLPGMGIAKNWEDNMTWESILELEKTGCDVSEMKEKFLAKQEGAQKEQESLNTERFATEQGNDKT